MGAAVLVAGWLALGPGPVSADHPSGFTAVGNHTAGIHLYLRGTSTGCSSGDLIGGYIPGQATNFSMRLRRNAIASCTTSSNLDTGASNFNRGHGVGWYVKVSASSSWHGAALSGAHIALPATFTNARATTPLAIRSGNSDWSGSYQSGGDDGWWHTASGSSATMTLTVPSTHSGDVYLHALMNGEDSSTYVNHRHWSARLEEATVNAFPLVVPWGASGAELTSELDDPDDLEWAASGGAQRARIFLRDGVHDGEYDANDTNAARSTFDTATIQVTSDADGSTAITGAKIASNSALTTVISNCTQSAVGNTCTINGGSGTSNVWPQGSGMTPLTTHQELYWSVPATHTGAAYLHVTLARSGALSRTFALRTWQPRTSSYPLVVPRNWETGALASGNMATGTFLYNGIGQRARVLIGAADHNDVYDASAATAAVSDLDSVTIRVASDRQGMNELSGGVISANVPTFGGAQALSGCSEAEAGPTCTIAIADWPSEQQTVGGTPTDVTLPLDINYQVPIATEGDAYLVVTVSKDGEGPRINRVRLQRHQPPTGHGDLYTLLYPAGTADNTNVWTQQLYYAADGGGNRVYLRAQLDSHGGVYRSGGTSNIKSDDLSAGRIRITSDPHGRNLLPGARIGGNAATDTNFNPGPSSFVCAISNTCDISVGEWARSVDRVATINFWFSVPTSHTGPVYVFAWGWISGTAIRSGATYPPTALKYDPPVKPAFTLIVPAPGGTVPSGEVEPVDYAAGGVTQQARVFLRAEEHEDEYDAADADADKANFTSAVITITSDAAGANAISGAVISQSDGSTVLSACTETSAGNTCTVTSANWPGTTTADPLDLHFSVPSGHTGAAYVSVALAPATGYVNVQKSLGYSSVANVYPLAMPIATADGTDLRAETRGWAAGGASQEATVNLRADSHRGTYSASAANVAPADVSSATISITSDKGGANPISGAKISSDAAGNTAVSACNESTAGHTCTVTGSSWPVTGGTTDELSFHFSVPASHSGDAYLTVSAAQSGRAARVFALKYGDLFLAVHPLAVPVSSGGDRETGDVKTGMRDYESAAGVNQAELYLREMPHSDAYAANDANVARSAFDEVRIRIATEEDGSTSISGAEITDAAGTSANADCTEASAGPVCTIAAANWDQGTGGTPLTLAENVYFTLPVGHDGPAWLVFSARMSGKLDRVFSVRYDNPYVSTFALAMPAGTSSGTDVTAATRFWAAGGATQQVTANLRAAPHGGRYTASDVNAAPGDFGSATIRITSDAEGQNLITGAAISSDAAGATALATGCTVSNTCTITSANWPATGGTTDALNFHFSVPAGHFGDAYVAITVAQSGSVSREFALKYDDATVAAVPLAAPVNRGTNLAPGVPSASDTNVDLTTRSRGWLQSYSGDRGRNRVAVYLRGTAHGNRYVAAHANAAPSAFDRVIIRLAKDQAGTDPATGVNLQAEDRSAAWSGVSPWTLGAISACDEAAAGPTCTIQSANWPATGGAASPLQIVFQMPDASTTAIPYYTGDLWVVVTVEQSGKTSRTFAYQFTDPWVPAHPLAVPQNAAGTVIGANLATAEREYAADAATQRARAIIRADQHLNMYDANADNAERGSFTRATIRIGTAGAFGTYTSLSGAVISQSDGSSAIAACDEGTAGNTCTIQSSNFPQDSGSPARTQPIDLYFSVPATTTEPVYVVVSTWTAGETQRDFALKYEPYLLVWPLAVPAPGGTRETGDVKTSTRDFAAAAAVNQAEVHLRSAAHSNTYSASGTNIERGDFDRVKLRIATEEDGSSPVTGAKFTDSAGTGTDSDCTEAAAGPLCTIPAADWDQATSGSPLRTLLETVYFTVPAGQLGPVWLVVTVEKDGKNPRVFSIKYDHPYAGFPLVVPFGTTTGTDVSGGAGNWAAGGASQQVSVYLRGDWHSDTFTSAETNIRDDAFTDATIKITEDAAGSTPITDAKISSDSAGQTVVSACTETTVGDTCTVTAANWPDTSNVTDNLDFYFSVPDTTSTTAYVFIELTASGKTNRSYALKYDPGLPVFPLVVPGGTSDGGSLTGTREFEEGGDRQQADIYLRDAWHSNTYTANADNAERSDFDSVEITIATDMAGTNAAAGAQIYALATGGGRPAGCTMSDSGATCTIQSGSWPQASSGTPLRTQGLTLHFSVPNDLARDVYVVVTVSKSGEQPRRFALRYNDPFAGAFPLAVPSPGGTEETGDLKAPTRSFAAGGATQRAKIYLRAGAHGNRYNSSHTNARDDAFGGVKIELATTSGGGTAVTGGVLSSDAAGNTAIANCTEGATAGAECTLTAANWPDTSNITDALEFYWSVPDNTNAAVYLLVTVTETGKTSRTFFLRYKPGLPVFPIVVPDGTATGTDLTAATREYAQANATQQATVYLRGASHSGTYNSSHTNAAKDLFDSVVIRVATSATGQTGATGAVLSSNSAGTTALSGCSEGSTPGHTCTISSANWPGTTTSDPLALHFSVPHDRPSDVQLVISVKKTGEPDRVFALPYQTPLTPAFPLAVPQNSSGTLETGNVKTPTRVWSRNGAVQRARLFLRDAAHSDAHDASHANVARAAFSTATITIATTSGGGTSVSGAKISSDAAGNTALTACSETTPGPVCTIDGQGQNLWPIDSNSLTEQLDIYWSVPDGTTTDAFLVLSVQLSGKNARTFFIEYGRNLPVFPLAMPDGTSTGVNVGTATRTFAEQGNTQTVQINLRAAPHSGVYTSSDTNALTSLFDRAIIRVATSATGATAVAGAQLQDVNGNAISACNEAASGPTCTITSANWPDSNSVADQLRAFFTVPPETGADVYFTVRLERSGQDDRVFALKYDDPYLKAFPLAAPIVGGSPESGDLAATKRSFEEGGNRQQVRVFLRDAWHGNEYDAADANVADAAISHVTIRIAADAAGSASATGALLYGAASGATELATGCTPSSGLCLITAANLPNAGDGTNAPLDLWFSVPDGRTTPAYVTVTAGHATLTQRVFALRYDPGLPVFPIAVPRTATDGYESGNLGTRTGAFAGNFARQKATVFLRAASHGNMYASSGQSNVDQSDSSLFDSVTLSITTAADGNTLISGARFYGDAGGAALQGCSSNTCTINRADWPSAGGLDLWFAVPDSRLEDSYLHVAVNKAGEPSRETATRYETSYVRAYQLIVPKTAASAYEAGTLATNTRRWLPEGGDQRAGVFLREQPQTSYVAGHANAPVTNFDSAVITITSDAAGNSPLANAEITSDGSSVLSACTESSAGNTCTVAVANWPQSGSPALATELDFQFSVPDSHQAAAYVHVALTKSGKTNRGGSLRWQPPLFVAAFPRAQALDDGGAPVTGAVGEYDAKAGTDRARISVGANQAGTAGAPIANFDRVIITITSDAAGTSPISGAVLASNAAGTAAISACNEATAGNTCTVPAASWPAVGAAAGNLNLFFSIPLAHGTDAYIFVRTENAGERDRVAALKFDAPSGALSNSASAVLDPRLSDGTRERDDDGDGDRLDNQRWYSTSASDRQRLGVRIYEIHRTDWSGSAELASFASLASTNALILTAHYTVGQTGTNLGATHIEFTQADGTTALGCSEASYSGGTCTLTRAALKTLMGVGGAADARRSFEFEFAFSIKAAFTNTADVTIQAQVNRHTGNSWNAEAVYARGVAAAANAQPFAMQLQGDGSPEQGDVVARDPQRRYAPGGQATPVNLRIYDTGTATTTYSASASLVSYSTISEVKLELKDRPSPNALIPGAAITALQNDGSTSACSEAMPGNVCTITAANYLASGPPRAAGYYRALPLDFSFTVPAGYTNSDFGNADLVITVVRTGSGTLSQRTRTFTLPFDGGTRAEPFAMAANAAFDAPADNQQWAAAGARTPVWLHVYNVAKSAFEPVTGTNTAQYWEFDQTAGVNVIEIELLDGQAGSAAPARARITAPDSDEKFAPCSEERPGPTCTITLAALKAYDSAATTDDDYVDPLKFAVSLPQGSTNSIRIKATVQRSDDVPGQSVKERKTGQFPLYAPWPYPLLAPVDQRGDPPAGEIGDTSWEYEPRGQRTPLLLRLYNARQPGAYLAPTAANMAALADFETVTLTVLDQDGAALTGARISARSGAALAACRPASHSCEITRAEWRALQPGSSSLASAALAFSVIVPASHGEAVAVRAEIKHSGRNAPVAYISSTPSGEDAVGTIKTGIDDDNGTRSTYYELRMVSPVKKAWALSLLDDEDGDGLRLCRQGETCTASAQQGAALGFAAAISRGLGSHPAKPNPDQDELVQYDEVDQLRITAVGADIVHRALCPPSAPLHPLDPALPATAPNDCTIPGPLLQAFHGAQPSDPIRPLELALVPKAASGTVTVAYDIAGSDDVIRNTDESQPAFQFSAAGGSPRLAATAFFDWTDPGSDYANARPALILAVGRADSRTDAPPVPTSALPGGLVPATFAELAQDSALQLAISLGSISFNGRPCPEDDAADGCSLQLSRADLLAASPAAAASEPISGLRVEYFLPLARNGPTTLTVTARPDGGAPVSGSLAIPHPAVSAPEGAAFLPADADGRIAPGATEELAAGFLFAVADSGPGWACLRTDPSFLELDDTGAAVSACTLSRAPAPAAGQDQDPPGTVYAWLAQGSYLALGGDAAFADGGKRLRLGGDSPWNQLRCGPADGVTGLAASGSRDLVCWVSDADGQRPRITASASPSGNPVSVSASLIPARGRRFQFLLGDGAQPTDRHAPAAAITIPGAASDGSLFGSAAIPAGAAALPASAALVRAGDAAGPVPDGATANLLLRINAADGRPADRERISSITITAGKGELGGPYCPDGGRACTFHARDGSALAIAADDEPGLTARIPITLDPPDGEGSLQLRAVVVSAAGARLSASLDLDYAGAAALIRIGEDLPVLHHHATSSAAAGAGAGSGSGAGSASADNRDSAMIPITATDRGGRVVALPLRASASITGPDGAAQNNFNIARDCSDGPTACKFRVAVTAGSSTPLPSGRYQLVVQAAGIPDASAEFGVAGPAANIEAETPTLPALGAPLAIRAQITDAQGNAVADGTQVRLSIRTPDGSPTPLIPLDPPPPSDDPAAANLKTKNGIAAATLVSASASIAILSLNAQDGATTPASLTLVLTPTDATDDGTGADGSGDGAAGADAVTQSGFSTWSGRTGATAAAALAASPNMQAIYLWNGKRWLRYAASPSGAPVPGSQNFPLLPGDLIFSPQ